MLMSSSAMKTVERYFKKGDFLEGTNMPILLSVSFVVMTSAIPLATFLLLYLTYTVCFVLTLTWSLIIILYIYLGHVNPKVYAQLLKTS